MKLGLFNVPEEIAKVILSHCNPVTRATFAQTSKENYREVTGTSFFRMRMNKEHSQNTIILNPFENLKYEHLISTDDQLDWIVNYLTPTFCKLYKLNMKQLWNNLTGPKAANFCEAIMRELERETPNTFIAQAAIALCGATQNLDLILTALNTQDSKTKSVLTSIIIKMDKPALLQKLTSMDAAQIKMAIWNCLKYDSPLTLTYLINTYTDLIKTFYNQNMTRQVLRNQKDPFLSVLSNAVSAGSIQCLPILLDNHIGTEKVYLEAAIVQLQTLKHSNNCLFVDKLNQLENLLTGFDPDLYVRICHEYRALGETLAAMSIMLR